MPKAFPALPLPQKARPISGTPKTVDGRLDGGNRRRVGNSGTAQGVSHAVAEPPSRSHSEAARLSGVGKHERTEPTYTRVISSTGGPAMQEIDGPIPAMGIPNRCPSMPRPAGWQAPSELPISCPSVYPAYGKSRRRGGPTGDSRPRRAELRSNPDGDGRILLWRG